jgi:hypothetical protein
MTEPLRPHAGIASARIIDLVVRRNGGYAALTSAGIDLFDDALATRTTIASEAVGTLLEVADGHFLVYSSSLHQSVDGKPFTPIETGGFLRDIVVTDGGFVAIGSDRLMFFHDDRIRTVEIIAELINGGAAASRGGVAVGGQEGLVLFDASGTQLARSEARWLTDAPIVVGDFIVAKGPSDTYIFDGDAQVRQRIDGARSSIRAFGNGVLVQEDVSDGPSDLSFWSVETGEADEQWRIERPRPWDRYIVDDRAVLGSGDAIDIIDVTGKVLATLPDHGYVRGAVAFAGGIAITADRLVWWREGEPVQILEHDVRPGLARAVPVGLATTEEDVILLWRTDVQGPEPTTVETSMPFGTPIVLDGSILTIESAGQFSLRARTLRGQAVGVKPTGNWRPATTRDEALRICERLIGRVFDGPLPEVAREGMYDTNTARLAQLPLAQTVDLYGRSWFAPSSLDEDALPYAMFARDAFVGELALALNTSPRVLSAAIRARKLALEPPRPVTGYDYLGTFTSSNTVIVADPCYFGRATLPSAMGYQLALKLNNVHDGTWHAFARNGTGKDSDRTAELVVVHETGFHVYASTPIGQIGVDGGCAGVFDKACPKRNSDHPLEEGIVHGLGAVTWSGWGDGGYPVYAGEHIGRIAKIRIPFIDDEPERDRSMPKSVGAAKPYSASTTFAAGDTLEHPKFGTGAVIRIGVDGKIDVRFADAIRTLIHARKR